MKDLRTEIENYVEALESDTLVSMSEFAINQRVVKDLKEILASTPY